jgi:ABC-type transporter Mla subunit MlaD
MSARGERPSSAAAAGDRIKAVLEAAEQSAAALRAEAAEEIEAQLAKAQTIAERLSTRADEIERALQGLAESVREELSALKADLEELRAVGEGIAAAHEEAAETADAEAAPVAEPDPAPAVVAEEHDPVAEEPEPAAAQPAAPAGEGHEGARLIALNMALNGSSREETAHYLSENFELDDPEALLDEVYARVSP